MLALLRSGEWIDARAKSYPRLLLLFAALAVVGMLAVTKDRLGPDHRPLGTDFSQVWVAGGEVLRGEVAKPYDIDRHIEEQRREFGPESAVYGWHYPPFFFAPAAALAHLPYLDALLIWQLSTAALYLLAILYILRRAPLARGDVLIAALAFPAALVNLGHGQNGFLTAALLGGAFALLDRRPLAAGALLALLAYKPQFAAALPVALIFGARWRALAAAAATFAAMSAASLLAFGTESWRAFFGSLDFTRRVVVEQGATGFEKIQSVFAAVRLTGGTVEAAYAAQSLVAALALLALALVWRSGADARLKAAAAIVATLLTTPYSLDYDMMALAPALAFCLAHGLELGFGPYEKSILAFAYAAPLGARAIAGMFFAPLGVIAIALLYASILRRAGLFASWRVAGGAKNESPPKQGSSAIALTKL